jgi:hypothetical protein
VFSCVANTDATGEHPSDARRIADIRRWIPGAEAAKRAFDEGRIARP